MTESSVICDFFPFFFTINGFGLSCFSVVNLCCVVSRVKYIFMLFEGELYFYAFLNFVKTFATL